MGNSLSWRQNSCVFLREAGETVYLIHEANMYSILDWSTKAGLYTTNESLLGNISIDDTIVDNENNNSMPYIIYKAIYDCGDRLKLILDKTADIASEGDNPYLFASALITQNLVISSCVDNVSFSASHKDQLTYLEFNLYELSGKLAMNLPIPNLISDSSYCEVMKNIHTISKNGDKAISSILNHLIGKADKNDKIFRIWMIAGTTAILFAALVPMIILYITFSVKINRMIKLIANLPKQVKDTAKEPLSFASIESSVIHGGNVYKTNAIARNSVFYLNILCIFVVAGVFIALCLSALDTNEELSNLETWYYYSWERMICLNEIGNDMMTLIMINSYPQLAQLKSMLLAKSELQVMYLQEIHNILTEGSGEIESSIGFDQELDRLQIENLCNLGRNPSSVHDMYACASINSQINVFFDIVRDIRNKPERYQGNLKNEFSMNMVHMLIHHLYPNIMQVTDRIAELTQFHYGYNIKSTAILAGIGLAVTFLDFFIAMSLTFIFNSNYKTIVRLIQRLPQNVIIETPEIINFFTESKSNKGEKMSICKSIVKGASESIIITNQSGIIETINHAVTNCLGYTPDQMLGRNLIDFIQNHDVKQNQDESMSFNVMFSGKLN